MSYVSKCTLILSTCQWLHTGGGSENVCVCVGGGGGGGEIILKTLLKERVLL